MTVAAATGSLVLALAAEPKFQALLVSSLNLNRLVMASLVTVASLVLIGPVEEYIYGAGLLGPAKLKVLAGSRNWSNL